MGKFFDLLEELQKKYQFTADRIFNCDETGLTTVPSKPSKVIAAKGKKQVGALSSAERGQLLTVDICMSASGNYIPPFFVFPRCRMKPGQLDNAPPRSQGVAQKRKLIQDKESSASAKKARKLGMGNSKSLHARQKRPDTCNSVTQ